MLILHWLALYLNMVLLSAFHWSNELERFHCDLPIVRMNIPCTNLHTRWRDRAALVTSVTLTLPCDQYSLNSNVHSIHSLLTDISVGKNRRWWSIGPNGKTNSGWVQATNTLIPKKRCNVMYTDTLIEVCGYNARPSTMNHIFLIC